MSASYSAQLFESLQHAATPSYAPAPASSDTSSGGRDAEEYTAVIEFQRTQIAQLRVRTAALEQQLSQYREKVLAHDLRDAGGSSPAASELQRLRAEVAAQAQEVARLKDERTGLMKKLFEQQKRIDELKEAAAAAAEPQRDPLPGAGAAAGALIADLTQRSSAGIKKGAGVREAALQLDAPPQPPPPPPPPPPAPAPAPAAAATITPPPSPGAGRDEVPEVPEGGGGGSKDAALLALADSSSGLTASLLQKQEQLRQQEVLLLALKQQQGQSRALVQQQQRQAQEQQALLQQQLQQAQLLQAQQALLQQQQLAQAQGLPGGGFGSGGGAPQWTAGRPTPFAPSPSSMSTSYGATPSSSSASSYSYGGGGAPAHFGGAGPGGSVHQGGGRFGTSHGPGGGAWGGPASPPPGVHPYFPHAGGPGGGPAMSPGGGGGGPAAPATPFSPAPRSAVHPDATSPPNSPLSGARVVQKVAPEPLTPAGWTIYHHPPAGVRWPDSMPFYQPLVEVGIPFIKHGRKGLPHKKLMWLDISVPHKPELVWQDGDRRDPDKVKEKSRLPLTNIVDIRAGQASEVLERSGKAAHAERYMVFANDSGGSLDVEAPTPEGRDWLFRRFADLFQAYAIAQKERLAGDAITLRVMGLMDAGVPVKADLAAAPPPPPSAAAGRGTTFGFSPGPPQPPGGAFMSPQFPHPPQPPHYLHQQQQPHHQFGQTGVGGGGGFSSPSYGGMGTTPVRGGGSYGPGPSPSPGYAAGGGGYQAGGQQQQHFFGQR